MERGLYIAAAGMLAEQARQDHISQDLANAATSGYKQDRVAQKNFAEALLENTRTKSQIGTLGTGPLITSSKTDFSQAPIKDTGAPLDLAISGEGFFAIRTANGTRYTRDGSFQADGKGQLVTQLGDVVLGPDNRPVTVGKDGTVDVSKVGVFALTNPVKAGDGQITGTAAGKGAGVVGSGALEVSGVDSARTMIEMMASLRAYEANQKVITTLDTTLQSTAQQVGNLPG
ncbi:MAG: flagellar hook-basal body protein [Baekduia sp.]